MRSTLLVHGAPNLQEPMLAIGAGRLTFTGRVTLGGPVEQSRLCGQRTKAHIEARSKRAFVCIGDNTKIGNGFTAVAEQSSILIGSSVNIGYSVEMVDARATPAKSPSAGRVGDGRTCRPVVIEDDVVIGEHVRIFGGVRICRGAQIASHSLVTCDVPEYTVYGGRPARQVSLVKRVPQWRRRGVDLTLHGF
jgi:acetyltransferase-like isoleucine patch superfamily enzyme